MSLWGVDSVNGSARVANVASIAQGSLPTLTLASPGVAYGYSRSGNGSLVLAGPPDDVSWSFVEGGGFLIEGREAGEHRATVNRLGRFEADAFWLTIAEFHPVTTFQELE